MLLCRTPAATILVAVKTTEIQDIAELGLDSGMNDTRTGNQEARPQLWYCEYAATTNKSSTKE